MSDRPDNLVLELLRGIRADMTNMRADMVTKSDHADLRSEMHSLRADVASDMVLLRHELKQEISSVRKNLGEQIVGLRRAVNEYHTSVIGHGILI